MLAKSELSYWLPLLVTGSNLEARLAHSEVDVALLLPATMSTSW